MALNMIASSGAKLAAVGAHGTALSLFHSSTPTAGFVLPVAGQGRASIPLRWSAAIRVSPLARRAKSVESREGSDREQDAYEVHNFLSSSAKRSIALLSRVSPPEEDVEAAAELKKYFSELIATADSMGDQLDRAAGVQGLIRGVHRLVELAYKSYKCPRVSAWTTEEVFVDYFISLGYKLSEPSSEYAYNKNLGQFPEADRRYLGSMQTSMNLASHVVDGLRTEPYILLHMFPILNEEDLKGLSDSPFPKGFPWSGI